MLPPPPGARVQLSLPHAPALALRLCLILLATTPAWGALAIDQVKSTDQSKAATNITSPSFSTTAANELLLAFVSSDATSAGVTVTGVTGAGLTWVLVQRTNVQMGTAEIWRAFASSKLSKVTVKATLSQSVAASLTVVTFTGTDTAGTNGSGAIGATGTGNANPGAPTATLVTTRNGSWVFGVGNDWDTATARTLGPNQTMVHQYLATVEDTYWVQRQTNTTPTAGTSVTINDTAPTGDSYNLSIVEVLPTLTAAAAPMVSSVTLNPTSVIGGTSSTGTVALGSAAPTGGLSVTLSSNNAAATVPASVTVAAGATTATFTVTTTAVASTVSATISAAFNGGIQTAALTVNPPALSSVTLNPTSVTGGTSSTGTVTLGSAAPTGGLTVTLSSNNAEATVPASVTIAAGATTATFTVTTTAVASTLSATISATFNGGTQTATLTVSPAVAVSISPTSASLVPGATQQFTATVTGTTNTAVTWTATGGTVSNSGLYTAGSTAGTYSVTATSQASSSSYASAAITISASVTVSISPTSATLAPAGTQQFTATVTGTTNTAVTWSVTGNGTVSSTGLYTAPSTPETDTVTATSVANTSSSATATVTVVSISISPPSASLSPGGTQQFTATVTGTTNTAVAWTATGGTITSGGLFTAPDTAGVYLITATSSGESATANVAVGASFFDDFTGTTINTTTWYVYNEPDISWSPSYDCFDSANVTVSGGNLVETAQVQSVCSGIAYTTGMVSWQTFNFTFGTVEYRAKFAGGQGTWPAIWLLGAACQPDANTGSCNWPNDSSDAAEIDITEVKEGDLTQPWQSLISDSSGWQTCQPTLSPDVTNWHVYGLAWTGSAVTWYVDGAQTCQFTSHIPQHAMFLLIDVYLGSQGGTINNSTLPQSNTVDYIAVFPESSGSAVAVTVNPSLATVSTGGTQQFTATVTGTANTAVTWSASCGTVSSTGLYTAPSTAGTCTVTATSQANTSSSASATVTVTAVLMGTQSLLNLDSNPVGQAQAFSEVAVASGTVGSIGVYVDSSNAATSAVIGIYSNSYGSPGTLLTSAAFTPVAGQWITVPVPSVAITQGTTYWIALMSTGGGALAYRDGSGSCSAPGSASGLSTLPSTWTTAQNWQECGISAYVLSGS